MRFVPFLLANLWRKPARTLLTGASLIVAFLLLGLMEPVVQLLTSPAATTNARWWVSPRHSISDMLPVHYHQQVSQSEGVEIASHQTWFGGTFVDAQSSAAFTRWAVSPVTFLQLNPQILLSAEEKRAFINTPTGAIVGRDIATRFDMEVGDRIPITADIWHNEDGSLWTFDLVGIYDNTPDAGSATNRFFVNYAFFDDYRVIGKGLVSQVLYTVEDETEAETVARKIDANFANSGMETRTTTESEYVLNYMNQLGNVGLMLRSVMGAVLFTILLLTANTMAQSVQERTIELAALKTFGFSDRRVICLILGEAVLLTVTSAAIGMSGAGWLLQYSDLLVPQMTTLNLGAMTMGLGLCLALGLAVLVTLPPTFVATRISIADALRR